MHNPDEGKTSTVVLTGDCLITRRLKPYNEANFTQMLEIIREADISFSNLEGLLTNYEGYPAAMSGGTYVVGDPIIADDLQWAGFNLFARANNHSMDWSFGGLLTTSAHLDARGMVHAGVGENLAVARSPAYLDTSAGRTAIISASSTFPPGAQAGQQRPDLPGRPGLNPLRYETTMEVPAGEIDHLRQMSEELGLEEMKRIRSAAFSRETQGCSDVFDLPGADFQFVAGEEYRVKTQPHRDDLKANLRAIEGAARQADWVIFSLHTHESAVGDLREPAEFVREFSRQAIDAGADAVVGHGPHYLRGIEIYNDRPIFYSLGNFIFQNESVRWLPHEIYDRYGLSLESTPDQLYDRRTDCDASGFPSAEMFWRTVMPEVKFSDRRLQSIILHPVTLGWELPRSRRGRPVLAEDDEAEDIIAEITKLSSKFDTPIKWADETRVGEVSLD